MKERRNLSSLFSVFESGNPDKTGKILKTVGAVTANAVLGLIVVAEVIKLLSRDTKTFDQIMLMASFGWLATIVLLAAFGTHYAGRDAGKKKFLSSVWYVLDRTFLYVLLPSILLAGGLILWAIITKQPAFR